MTHRTMPPHLLILLLLLLVPDYIRCEDIGHKDRTIIMQADVETVVITSDLQIIEDTITINKIKLGDAREKILNNELKENKGDKSKSKGLLSVIASCGSLTKQTQARLQELKNSTNSNTIRQKRGIEFLGDFLSAITGVPSAKDHRKVIEMLWAVKSRTEGYENILKTSTKLNSQMLDTLHLHDEKFDIYKDQLSVFDKVISRNSDQIDKTILSLSIFAKLLVSNYALNAVLSRAEQIMAKGDIERLSRYSISEHEIQDLIDKIYMRRRTSAPIFDKEDSHYYYSLRLAHTWVDPEKLTLNTILQIPIARLAEHQKLTLLTAPNTLQNDLHMAVVNEGRNEYRLLSSTDYANCIPTAKGMICQKREISISPKTGCVIKQHNCIKWADKIVHDLTNTEILISLPETLNATLSCKDLERRQITLPTTSLVQLDLNCELESKMFKVSKLSFRHLEEVTINRGMGLQLDISEEVTALTKGQVSHLITEMQTASTNIESLNMTNEILLQTIDAHKNVSDERWQEISTGWTAWERLAIWAAVAGEALIIVAVTICICRMYCSLLKRNGGGAPSAESKEYSGLRNRILDLETNILMNKRTVPALTQDADIEVAD